MSEDGKSREMDSKTRLRLWIRLLKLSRQVESSLRERLRTEFDTTLPRFDVLAVLFQHTDGLKMSELSDQLLVSNGSVTVVVDRLVKEGLVERKAVPGDRRALLVTLTKDGRKHFETQAAQHENWVDELLGSISTKQATQIIKIIDRAQD